MAMFCSLLCTISQGILQHSKAILRLVKIFSRVICNHMFLGMFTLQILVREPRSLQACTVGSDQADLAGSCHLSQCR